jgi:hypothetical protein
MDKKIVKDIVRPLQKKQHLYAVASRPADETSAEILQDIQRKVNESSNLNSKFDALMFKVEKIEEEQSKVSKTVGLIHNALYDPDNGLFSRIAAVKSTHSEEKADIEKQLIEINAWKNQSEKDENRSSAEGKEIHKKVESHQNTIESLERWKGNVNSLGKWTLAAIAGGTITIIFRAVYELFIVQ